MKLELNDLKTVIAIVCATVAAMVYFTPIKVFDAGVVNTAKADAEIIERVVEVESRLDGIDTAYLKKRLDALEARYGHTNCYRMSDKDKEECLWLKDALARFGK